MEEDRYAVVLRMGLPPSSNNRLLWRRGRAVLAPAYRKWKQQAVEYIAGEFEDHDLPYFPSDAEYRVLVALGWPDRRRRDIDGPIKPILDAITESCVAWADDSQVVSLQVHLVCRKCEPLATVAIEPLAETGVVKEGPLRD
jgi:Holliday junction resolvase RusA-like endonuclease